MEARQRLVDPAATAPLVPEPAVAREATSRRMSDSPVELIISWLLRVGVWSSIAIITAGFVMLFVGDRTALVHLHPGGLQGLLHDGISGEPASLQSYAGVVSAVRQGQAYGVIMLGLLVLLLTPVLRVAVSIVAFLLEGDRLYAAITSAVLLLLLTGILLGKAGG
jgi:uncharacterized membrane protein